MDIERNTAILFWRSIWCAAERSTAMRPSYLRLPAIAIALTNRKRMTPPNYREAV